MAAIIRLDLDVSNMTVQGGLELGKDKAAKRDRWELCFSSAVLKIQWASIRSPQLPLRLLATGKVYLK